MIAIADFASENTGIKSEISESEVGCIESGVGCIESGVG